MTHSIAFVKNNAVGSGLPNGSFVFVSALTGYYGREVLLFCTATVVEDGYFCS